MQNAPRSRPALSAITTMLLAALVLAGCGGNRGPQPVSAERQAQLLAESRFPDAPLAGKTYMSFSPFFGYQVTYFGPEGRNWLWFPGNARSLPGEWKITDAETTSPQLCFRYPERSYNPVTKQRGGKFKCTQLNGYYRRTVTNVLDGDPFELAGGTVPYVREQCDPPAAFGHTPEDIGPLFRTVRDSGVCAK